MRVDQVSIQRLWMVIRLGGYLGRGSCIMQIGKLVQNMSSMSHDWKSASSREETIFLLKILFLPTMTGSTWCIMKN